MSLPTTTKPIQSSIRSFFTSAAPKYAPPPGQSPPPVRHGPPPPPPPPPPKAQQPQPPPPQKGQDETQQEHQEENAQENQQEIDDQETPSRLPSIPPSADIRIPTEADIPPLRRINALLLPVSYPDSFYAYAADNPLSRVITWSHDGQQDPKIIGGIVCRVEDTTHPRRRSNDDDSNDDGGGGGAAIPPAEKNLYIRSLSLLAPYRSMGLARAALEHILATVAADKASRVVGVTAHVWTENEDGMRWYERQGFVRDSVQPLRGYYLKLRPDTAWLVRRPVSSPQSSLAPPSRRRNAPDKRLPPVPIKSVTAAVVNLPPPPPPPPGPPATSGPKPAPGQSFQNQRPDTEWNDLPPDMAPVSVGAGVAAAAAAPSSRSSSGAPRKKRDRAYPAAAFGGN
ncbi:hypothetical protein E4U54_000181 [Claviceps lovelessii]|nr:hypothetical protein E4U54_000181 [Claviceps lovelessii]